MGKEIDQEIREQAEELYILDGRTYEQVAEATGVSVSQLKNWGADGQWKRQRQEHRQTHRGIRANLTKLRKDFFEKAVQSLDPQDVYAAVRLEALATRQATKQEEAAPDIDRPKLFLEDMEFVAETLRDVDPQGLKVLARNFETIVNRFKEKHAQAT